MTAPEGDVVTFTYDDAERIWKQWAADADDLLARAAFERTLRWAIGMEDEGLYFRPGGWSIDLPATLLRLACAAAILAAGFQMAGLEDLDRELIITTAGLVSAMGVRPVKLTSSDRLLVERMRGRSLENVAVSAKDARDVLPRRLRSKVTREDVTDALERLVAAGFADRAGEDEYFLRGEGSEAWLRITLGSAETS